MVRDWLTELESELDAHMVLFEEYQDDLDMDSTAYLGGFCQGLRSKARHQPAHAWNGRQGEFYEMGWIDGNAKRRELIKSVK